LIAGDVSRRRSDHGCGKTGSYERRVQTLRRRRSGAGGLEGEKVGDGAGGGGQSKIRSVDDLLCERPAASDVNRLSTVMRFPATSAAFDASLGAAQIFGAWQFVARVIDHFIGLQPGRSIGTEVSNLLRKNYQDKDKECFQQDRSEHAAVGKNTVRGFASQAPFRAGKGRADGGSKLLPTRRPLDQELGRVVKLDRFLFELEGAGQV
jgi:hypothetical protein